MMRKVSDDIGDDLIKLGQAIKDSKVFEKLDDINAATVDMEKFKLFDERLKKIENTYKSNNPYQPKASSLSYLSSSSKANTKKDQDALTDLEERFDTFQELMEEIKDEIKKDIPKCYKISEYNHICRINNSRIVDDSIPIMWLRSWNDLEVDAPAENLSEFSKLRKDEVTDTFNMYEMEEVFPITSKKNLALLIGLNAELIK
ncbi:unnamed protein product [Brachionus calyciflorus]|uniref:Uncharacterized protein n=1 Tax=Brachionus calyciflorus TaxID=104777 RepID=A0A813TFN5_9BILA|nr:unnamed protein product [Brachionus calyciflorus]